MEKKYKQIGNKNAHIGLESKKKLQRICLIVREIQALLNELNELGGGDSVIIPLDPRN